MSGGSAPLPKAPSVDAAGRPASPDEAALSGGVPGTDAQAPGQLAPVQSQPFPDACRTGGRARPSEAGVRASSVPAQAWNC